MLGMLAKVNLKLIKDVVIEIASCEVENSIREGIRG